VSLSSSDVLAALRESTGSRHSIIDSAMPLSTAAPTLHDYRLHLQLIAAWLAPLERWLAGFADGPQGVLPVVERMPLIERDLNDVSLRALPGVEAEAGADTGGQTAKPPASSDAAYRWGVCYVIEGSQLGGAVLYRQLRDALAPHPLRYLSGDGVPPGPRWKSFMEGLRENVCTPRDIARACDGAADAFDRLLSLLPAQAE
jgi:heme oxygenase (biliverdin-IX-beta and delta-forming)